MTKNHPPFECPVCGADVPRNAKACPDCGADERSGWNEDDTRYDGLDLPDSAFEPASKPKERVARRDGGWKVVGIVLLIALILAFVF